MPDQLNYYDILGVLPGATTDEVLSSYAAKIAVLAPDRIAGAPTKVRTAADRARGALELARSTLTDPAIRHVYDRESGVIRVGGGLARMPPVPSEGDWTWAGNVFGANPDGPTEYLGMIADWLAPRPARSRKVTVPDVRGLFVSPARRLMSLTGLHAELVQLTKNPVPVEGLVVDQYPQSGSTARRSSVITVHVWHPAQQRSQTA